MFDRSCVLNHLLLKTRFDAGRTFPQTPWWGRLRPPHAPPVKEFGYSVCFYNHLIILNIALKVAIYRLITLFDFDTNLELV